MPKDLEKHSYSGEIQISNPQFSELKISPLKEILLSSEKNGRNFKTQSGGSKKRKDVSYKIILRAVKRFYSKILNLENNRKQWTTKKEENNFFLKVNFNFKILISKFHTNNSPMKN